METIVLWEIIVIFGENVNTIYHFHDLYPNLLVTPFFCSMCPTYVIVTCYNSKLKTNA
jgi:hypothetical protein